MKFTAKIKDIGRTLTGSLTITLESARLDTAEAVELSQVDRLDVEIRKQRKKRSLDANRYYWELTSRLAEALHVSKPYVHNCMLRRYGQYETVGGELVCSAIRDTDEARKQVDEAEMYHLKPTSRVIEGKNGVLFRTYIMLKGSSRYDTKEMSHLIDGLISECKEMGIETIQPEEFERMMAAYGKKIKKRADG